MPIRAVPLLSSLTSRLSFAVGVSRLVSFLLFFIIASRQYSGDRGPGPERLASLASSREHSPLLFRLRRPTHLAAKILLNSILDLLSTNFSPRPCSTSEPFLPFFPPLFSPQSNPLYRVDETARNGCVGGTDSLTLIREGRDAPSRCARTRASLCRNSRYSERDESPPVRRWDRRVVAPAK